VQEASSMLIEQALEQSVNLSKPLTVLDLCAAPGGKTTLLASLLSPDSLLLANEVIRSRVSVLKENLQKWGLPNCHVSNHDPEDFAQLEGFFDVILVDAPCSGEGLFRKDPAAINEWSPDSVQLCAGRQKRILEAAVPLLKHKGVLIYSTCTYNDVENQANADWLVQAMGLDEINLTIPDEWGVVTRSRGLQCYPHRLRGEGFFMGVFRKPVGEEYEEYVHGFRSLKPIHHKDAAKVPKWLRNPDDFSLFIKPNMEVVALLNSQISELKIVDRYLPAKGLGLTMGVLKGNDFVPDHALALSTALNDTVPRIELTENEALLFLKKESPQMEAPRGWLLATHRGLPLGWMKGLGNRINNYLPNEWRIRMQLEG
jgi:NOL1/NOP2/fmu family ribosome biogenesis protein/23S rRNA U2552 (ribose-2'-O)-methylase RlmE/FtsJ